MKKEEVLEIARMSDAGFGSDIENCDPLSDCLIGYEAIAAFAGEVERRTLERAITQTIGKGFVSEYYSYDFIDAIRALKESK